MISFEKRIQETWALNSTIIKYDKESILKKIEHIMNELINNFAPIQAYEVIFEADCHRIISKRGTEIVNDHEKMKQVNQQIKEQQEQNPHGDVIVKLTD